MQKIVRILRHPVSLLLILAAVGFVVAADWYVALPPNATATYVGSARCAECHTKEHAQWLGSDHDRAMEIANDESVLGDFDDAEFTYQGVTSRMFKRDGKFFIHTEGPDGEFSDFEIKYTFGVDPLQQYMVEFPDGRVQVLRVSWDLIRGEWFYVTPPDVTAERILPGDPLHWTGNAQNWNHTCAACHSTDLHKNYDVATDTYRTTFAEIDVGCEACHGPGSLHVELAESVSLFWDRNLGYATETLNEEKATNQIESCAACHARRAEVHAPFRPGEKFLDDFDPTLLYTGLYHGDGQILDEVYVYGSFLQSKMHGENVRCTDCHNPHSLTLKFEGNRLCGQCHTPGVYDTPSHHHHEVGKEGTQCVECHMRSQVYMVIDPRRDHSFRVPRPDLTVSLGTPNACADCHEEPATWAAEKVREWYGDQRADDPHFAPAFVAARNGEEGAEALLADVVDRPRADISRATAVAMLAGYESARSRATRLKALHDTNSLVRLAAVRALPTVGPAEAVALLAPRLTDHVRVVRAAAARQLAGVPRQHFGPRQRDALAAAIKEYKAAQSLALDRAAGQMNLGQLATARGQLDEAIRSYRHAIRLEPYLTGPRSQLANALQARLEEQARAGEATSEQMEAVRQESDRLYSEEAENLARDTILVPQDATTRYRYASVLILLKRYEEAEEVYREVCRLNPQAYEPHLALALLFEKQEKWDAALDVLELIDELRPNDRNVSAIRARIRAVRPPRGQEL